MIDFRQDAIAVYSKERTVSYKELFSLVQSAKPKAVFYAPPTLDTIVNILACLLFQIPFYPISPREPHFPEIPSCKPFHCSCLMTSGSTGKPKFAAHTWENHYQSAINPHKDLILSPSDRWQLSLPLNHIGGLAILFRCFLQGAAVLLPDMPIENATLLSFVPTQLKRYLENPPKVAHPRAILVGGAPIPESLCKSAHEKGLPLYLTYGMTEMSSQIATAPYDPKIGVCFGKPLAGRELKLAPDGEILVKGKTLFSGYLNQNTPLEDGWFKTNDLGEVTQHGLIVKGRKDNMIISGGENIHLEEIERAFLEIPQIANVKVAARHDLEYGQRPTAQITLNTSISVESLIEILQKSLPKYKIPHKGDIEFTQKST